MRKYYRFAAFISYSSRDTVFAKQLHKFLESYRIPKKLGPFDLIGGGKINRVFPVFRDREELPSGQLSESIESALTESRCLIVICSLNSVRSEWVNREINFFRSLGEERQIFPIIASNVAWAEENAGPLTSGCFPEAIRDTHLLAGDARKSKDGFRMACLKVVAGIANLKLGQLTQRDRVRRRRQAILITCGTLLLLGLTTIGIIAVGLQRQRTALTAEALNLSDSSDSLSAFPFAIAGLGEQGMLFPFRAANAKSTLTKVGAELGLIHIFDGQSIEQEMSRNGSLILSLTMDKQLKIWDRNTNQKYVIEDIRSFTLAPSGKLIAFQLWNGDIGVWIRANGNINNLATYDNYYELHFTPSEYFVFGEDNSDGQHRAWQIETRKEIRVPGSPNYGGSKLIQGDHAIITTISSEKFIWTDLTSGNTQELPITSIEDISGDGRLMFVKSKDGDGYFAVERKTGKPFFEKNLLIMKFDFPDNGSDYVSIQTSESSEIVSITDKKTRKIFPVGTSLAFDFYTNVARVLWVNTPDERTSIFDLKTMTTLDVTKFLADSDIAELTPDETQLFKYTESSKRISRLNIQSGEEKDFVYSGDLDSFYPFSLSKSGDRLLTRPDLGPKYLIDFKSKTPIQVINHEADVLIDEQLLILAVKSGNLRFSVWAVSTIEPDRKMNTQAVCSLSPAAPPFTHADRNGSNQSALQGRPWNPCDWRGLSSTEGWAQLWKQWQIRFGFESDYRCGQKTAYGKSELSSNLEDYCKSIK